MAAASRLILLARAFNNPGSAPPITGNIVKLPGQVFTRDPTSVTGAKFVAGGGVAPYTITPTGLVGTNIAMAADGTLSYSGAVTIGHKPFSVLVTDSAANSQTFQVSIDVKSRLTLTQLPVTLTETGHAYASSFLISGATGAVTCSASGPFHNMTLNTATLRISGTVTGTGTATFTTTITDAGTGDTLPASVTIQINSAWTPTTFPNQIVYVGVPYNQNFAIPASFLPMALIGVPALPTGLTAITNLGTLDAFGNVAIPASITVSGVCPPATFTRQALLQTVNLTCTDSQGIGHTQAIPFLITNPGAIQPKQGGSGVGFSGPINANYVGPAVTNDGVTMTVDTTQAPGYVFPITSTWSAGNAYTATPSPAMAALVSGQTIVTTFSATNTGSSTLNISGLGAKNILFGGAALAASVLKVNTPYALYYDGTQYNVVGTIGGSSGALTPSTLTTSTTVASNGEFFVNANALTTTGPASPAQGDQLSFEFATTLTSWTFNPNSLKIETTTGNMTWDVTKADGGLAPLVLVYSNATDGWKVK